MSLNKEFDPSEFYRDVKELYLRAKLFVAGDEDGLGTSLAIDACAKYFEEDVD